ncbi:MAG TPA: cytochrome P450 [Ktedonobacterales bacterium]|nr:cytochrome P450 [Ktedonobacterales bacterium]
MDQDIHKDFSLTALRRHYIHPHALYDAIRSHDSIYFDAASCCWLVTGHDPVVAILGDARFSSRLGASASMFPPSISKQMLFMDGEEHQRAQQVMLRPLAQMVKQMPDAIKGWATASLDAASRKGEIDIVRDFASPLSLLTIAQVLGIPTGDTAMLHELERWSDTFGDVTSGYFRGNMQDVRQLEEYFRQLIATKRRAPSEDLLSAFIQAGDIFTEEDLIANCMMVFAAGRITTKKLLGDGVPALAQHWSHTQADFQENPRALSTSLREELLRLITPTRYLIREAVEDVEMSSPAVGNHQIHQGEKMLLFLEAADYDPAVFAQPMDLDAHRRPNKHIAFGYGNHQCPGATLARVEIQIALETLLASVADLRLKPDQEPQWNPNPNLGGATSWPLALTASSLTQ